MKGRVLVADDDADNRFVASETLRHGGYSVIQACDGEEAVTQALAQAPDLILMDLAMPRMDGIEAVRQIRAALGKKLPILAYTASVRAGGFSAEIVAEGCDEVLLKPVAPRRLVERVAHWIQQRSTEAGHA